MIVSVNGLVLNDPLSNNGIYLDEPIDGLGLAPIRTSSGDYSGRDGGYVAAQFSGMRLISLTGKIFSSSPATLETTRKALAAAIAQSSITLTITTNGGNQYLITCNVATLDMPIQRSPFKAPFNLQLIAPDPVIYDNSTGGALSTSIGLSVGGGYATPVNWPVNWAPGTVATTITNSGATTVYPTITLTGVMTNPIIKNETTGQFFKLTGFTSAPGDVVVINMKDRTVILNGGNIQPFVSSDTTWWTLAVGATSVTLKTSNSADTVTGVISWRNGYKGI